jgi:hypothetical protein
MHSFIYLSAYRTVVCKECRYGVPAMGVYRHLVGQKHYDVWKGERKRITDQICRIPRIIKTEEQLKEFQFPAPVSQAIPGLKVSRTDGRKCRMCLYISCD